MAPGELETSARRFFELIFNDRNLSLATEMLAANFVEHLPPLSDPVSKPVGPNSHFKALLEASDDLQVEILDLVVDGPRVAIRARYQGTDTGGLFPGMPARGRHFELEGIDVLIVDDQGRFAEHIGIVDMREAMEQLGIVSSWSPPAP